MNDITHILAIYLIQLQEVCKFVKLNNYLADCQR